MKFVSVLLPFMFLLNCVGLNTQVLQTANVLPRNHFRVAGGCGNGVSAAIGPLWLKDKTWKDTVSVSELTNAFPIDLKTGLQFHLDFGYGLINNLELQFKSWTSMAEDNAKGFRGGIKFSLNQFFPNLPIKLSVMPAVLELNSSIIWDTDWANSGVSDNSQIPLEVIYKITGFDFPMVMDRSFNKYVSLYFAPEYSLLSVEMPAFPVVALDWAASLPSNSFVVHRLGAAGGLSVEVKPGFFRFEMEYNYLIGPTRDFVGALNVGMGVGIEY